ADLVLLNSGVILEDFDAGIVAYKDVHYKCPHPINLSVVNIKVDELKEVIRVYLTDECVNIKLVGLQFRGENLGRMVLVVSEDNTDFHETGEFVTEVNYNGAPLDSNRVYSVATADAFTFGSLLPGIAREEEKDLLLPDFIRNILARTLQKHFSK